MTTQHTDSSLVISIDVDDSSTSIRHLLLYNRIIINITSQINFSHYLNRERSLSIEDYIYP
jgi:hypothetical protein